MEVTALTSQRVTAPYFRTCLVHVLFTGPGLAVQAHGACHEGQLNGAPLQSGSTDQLRPSGAQAHLSLPESLPPHQDTLGVWPVSRAHRVRRLPAEGPCPPAHGSKPSVPCQVNPEPGGL